MSGMDTVAGLSQSYRYLPTVFRSLSNRSTPPHPRENSSLLSPIHPPGSADPVFSASPLSPFCLILSTSQDQKGPPASTYAKVSLKGGDIFIFGPRLISFLLLDEPYKCT